MLYDSEGSGNGVIHLIKITKTINLNSNNNFTIQKKK